MQKIALVNEMHQIKKGGVYHSNEALKSALSSLGAKVEIISIKKRGLLFNKFVSIPYFKEVFIWPVWNRFIIKKLEKQGYDVILYRGSTSLLLIRKTRIKTVIYTRGILDRQVRILLNIEISILLKILFLLAWPIIYIFEYISMRRADRIIASKDIFVDYIHKRFNIKKSKMVVIPQMIDLSVKKLDVDKVYDLLFVGRLSVPKNWGMIEKISKIKKYKIAAAVPDDIDENTFNSHVKVFKNIPYSEMAKLYHSTKIFIMPSHIESGPRVTLEAMSCGAAIVASVDGGGGFVKNDVNGYVIESNNPNDYIEAIDRLLANKDLRQLMSINNRKKSLEYSTEHLGPKYLEALNFS